MGWDYNPRHNTVDKIRAADREGWSSKEMTCVVLADAPGKGVNWTVREYRKPGAEPYRRICCLIIDRQGSELWTKGLETPCHPFYYDCPLAFLDLVPELPGGDATWRAKVRALHGIHEQPPIATV